MDTMPTIRRRCTATNRQGGRCGRAPIPAGTVCTSHGGASPAVRNAARRRLLDLIDPAIAILADIIADDAQPAAVRLRAAENVLDRAGYPRRSQLEPVDPEALAARIADLADELDPDDEGAADD